MIPKNSEFYGKFHEWNSFGDASFGSCSITMRSTSGGICYFRSFPIIWRTKRQGIRTYSTAESEWVSAADLIVLTLGIGFSDFFSN